MSNKLNNVLFLQKCIIVDGKGRILALRRNPNDLRRPGCWDLPGGHYEQGETVDECITREVLEETSLDVDSVSPVHITSNMGKTYDDINVIALAQSASNWRGEVKLSSEHIEYRWVTPSEFLTLETGDDGGFLKDSVRAFDIFKK